MKKTIYFLFIFAFQFTFSQSADILLNGTVSAENNQIKNVSSPTDSNDAATKSYVDSSITNSNNNQSINSISVGLTGELYNNFDGKKYETIILCDGKKWTRQFLRSTHFNNGDEIPLVQDANAWANLETPARSYYEGEGAFAPEIMDNSIGYIYNWFVIEDERGIAPEGWRVATQNDWNTLIECLGGQNIAGGKIKNSGRYFIYDMSGFIDSFIYWSIPNIGSTISNEASNSSGLSVMPFGFREGANGNFYNWYSQVIIWGDSDEAPSRVEVFSNSAGVLTGTTDPYDGYYVILVKE
tara:strand:+ start:74 stop:964 length:891 start_codon:yes stop_codon:yes gene_type:complete